MNFTRRSFLRTYREVPVEIRRQGREKHLHGTMRDACRDGMQLTTDQFIAPGSPIVILPRERCEIAMRGVMGEGRPAMVLWCRPIADRDARCFTVGVQFMHGPNGLPPVRQPLADTDG